MRIGVENCPDSSIQARPVISPFPFSEYAEEARSPQRTIPIATYLAVTLLACFYAFTFWVLTVAFGVDGIIAFATGENFESMIFEASGSYLGSWAAICIQVLIVTSFFACILAFHNAAARYMYSRAANGSCLRPWSASADATTPRRPPPSC